MKYLVAGAGGFIGGHIVKQLLLDGHQVVAVDLKPQDKWFQVFKEPKNYFDTDLTEKANCLKHVSDVDTVINMACNMGGMGFIENNKAECMISVLINTHLLIACKKNNIKNYFFSSSACAYNKDLNKHSSKGLRKQMHILPCLKMDMDGKNYLVKECAGTFKKILG
jgi:GDP-D-mannose 3', 5'-epimerase